MKKTYFYAWLCGALMAWVATMFLLAMINVNIFFDLHGVRFWALNVLWPAVAGGFTVVLEYLSRRM